ncbi:MAG: hypothetical protein ABR969_06825 [Sedimentisphaerales bacterium]|jgi:hypothetical protein
MSTSNISAATSSMIAMAAAALQEANEIPATTMKEAARGDQQAIRKLAKTQQQQIQPETPAPTPEQGAGEIVNYSA